MAVTFLTDKDKSILDQQIAALSEELNSLQRGYVFNNSVLTESGYVEADGTNAEHAGFVRSGFLPLGGQNKITIRKPLTNYGSIIAFYADDVASAFIAGHQVLGDSDSNISYDVPAHAKYVRFSYVAGQSFYAYSTIEEIVGGKIERETYKRIYDMTSKLVLPTSVQKVKLIGDSVTAGVGGSGYNPDGEVIYNGYQVNTSGTCWANMLKANLESDLIAVNNFGVSGKKSCDIVENLPSLIRADDTLVICMIGTNDRVGIDSITGQDTTMQSLYNNLCTIKEYCDSVGKDVIFMSSIPCVEGGEVNVHFRTEDVDKVYMKLSSKYNIEYISMYKELKQYCQYTGKELGTLLVDGLHPTDYGYEVMFNIISRKLGLPAKITVAPN